MERSGLRLVEWYWSSRFSGCRWWQNRPFLRRRGRRSCWWGAIRLSRRYRDGDLLGRRRWHGCGGCTVHRFGVVLEVQLGIVGDDPGGVCSCDETPDRSCLFPPREGSMLHKYIMRRTWCAVQRFRYVTSTCDARWTRLSCEPVEIGHAGTDSVSVARWSGVECETKAGPNAIRSVRRGR